MFTIIFTPEWSNSIFEGLRIEAENEIQAVANAARMSKYSKVLCVTEEPGLLEYSSSNVIPSSFHCSDIPLVALYKNGNVKFTTIEIPITDRNRDKKKYDEEDLIMAVRNILLRKSGNKIPPDHVLVGDRHVEVAIGDCYSGYDDSIEPYHNLSFK